MVKVPHARIGNILAKPSIIFKLKKMSEPEISDSVSLV